MTSSVNEASHDAASRVRAALANLDRPCYIVRSETGIGATDEPGHGDTVLAAVGSTPVSNLGSPEFRRAHGTSMAYMAGAMAGGVASEDLVLAMARKGYLASYGAAGQLPERIERALQRFTREIPGRPYACNIIHSPHELELERATVELCLNNDVRCVEASAFMEVTPSIVRYRVAGLSRRADGRVVPRNRVIAKVSRAEVAAQFLAAPPPAMVSRLVEEGLLTADQAALAPHVTLADDITAEGDSGGHTDRRPLNVLLPLLIEVRNASAARQRGAARVRVGAAGGIGTPTAAWAAFAAGADYVVTGSVNQACVESGTSDAVRQLLAQAGPDDCDMAPAADMFELGVDLQVLRRGTLFPMRAKRLRTLYNSYGSFSDLPEKERDRLERDILGKPVDDVWADCVEYFNRRDPEQIERAMDDPKRRMALVFRWYLGMASRWATTGEAGRDRDYQVWCGPAMGAFNLWTQGTALAEPGNRRVAEVAHALMAGAAVASRVSTLRAAGVVLPPAYASFRPPVVTR